MRPPASFPAALALACCALVSCATDRTGLPVRRPPVGLQGERADYIIVGMPENALLAELRSEIRRQAILALGGSGSHRLYLELGNGRQVTYGVEGPYGALDAWVTSVGKMEPLEDWGRIEGLQLDPEKRSR